MRSYALRHVLPTKRAEAAHLYAMFAGLGDIEDDFLIACNDIMFFDTPSFDGAFYRAIPCAKQNLWALAR